MPPEADDRAIEVLLERFNHLIETVVALNTVPRDFDTGHELYRAEIHTVDAIGRNEGLSLTRLAELMGVTKGAASQMVTRLAEKDLVVKERAAHRRGLGLALTERGWRGFHAHVEFHAQMHHAVHTWFGESVGDDVERTTACLHDLIGIVDTFANATKPD